MQLRRLEDTKNTKDVSFVPSCFRGCIEETRPGGTNAIQTKRLCHVDSRSFGRARHGLGAIGDGRLNCWCKHHAKTARRRDIAANDPDLSASGRDALPERLPASAHLRTALPRDGGGCAEG